MESINSAIKQERIEEEYKNEVQVPVAGFSPEREVKKEIMSSDELVSPQNSTRIVDPADMNNSMNMSMDMMNVDIQGNFLHFIRLNMYFKIFTYINFILDQKKIKRRQYYAKRRQSQGKDVNSTMIPKKRHRKVIKKIMCIF